MPRLALIALIALTAAPLRAEPCRLALALGFDVSRSVDAAAYEVQLGAIVAALFDAEIRAALLAPPGPVAVAVYEWSGRRQQRLLQDWTLIRAEDDIDRLARTVVLASRRYDGLTAVGAALDYGWRLLRRAPDCDAQVLDLAGDGQNNDGPDPARIHARRDFGRITVNGLAIGGHESGILRYYETQVIHGPGAFAEFAATHAEFGAALRRKLLRELDPPLLGGSGPRGPAGARGGRVGAPPPDRRDRSPGATAQAASSPASPRSISTTVSATP